MTRKYKILSIDAQRDGSGWAWNQWYVIGDTTINIKSSNRKILKMMRDEGFLSENSKGKVGIEDDQYNIVITERSNGRPLYAIEYGNQD